ncbi:KxYKxGKxW signal peptide domain-containing protein [Lacticaseibacillus paracasei]
MIFDTKQHYKMYKKGKYWAFAALDCIIKVTTQKM